MAYKNNKWRLKLKIIKATKENIPEIVYLYSFVQNLHETHHPDLFKPAANDSNIEKFFEEALDKENSYILIAYKNNEALGYIWAELQHIEHPQLYKHEQFYINHISVHKEFKGQGIGKALLEEIESIAQKHGITKFALDVWEFNKDAQDFFKKLGFSVYNVNMWKKIT